MVGVDDVAAAVLTRTGPVSTMKLQKLVFYSQERHLDVMTTEIERAKQA